MATAPELAALLRELRERADLSQLEVSLRAGLSENYYGMIEHERRRPSGPALQAILNVLPCTSEERMRAIRLLAGSLFPDALLHELQGEARVPADTIRRRPKRRGIVRATVLLALTGGAALATPPRVEGARPITVADECPSRGILSRRRRERRRRYAILGTRCA